jgi:hypothetical protein
MGDDSPFREPAKPSMYNGTARKGLFTPGERNDSDPDWLRSVTTRNDVDVYLAGCVAEVQSKVAGGGGLSLTEWERTFIDSISKRMAIAEPGLQPLTGKQLVVLKRLAEKVAQSIANRMAAGFL